MPKDFSSVTGRLQEALNLSAELPDSSKARLRIVQAQIDAIARGDIATVLATATEDVTLDIFAPPEFGWIRQAHGAEELRRAIEQNFGEVEDQRPEVTQVYAEGQDVVLFGREQGRIRPTGKPYDVEFVQRFTFRDGRLAAVRIIAAHRQ